MTCTAYNLTCMTCTLSHLQRTTSCTANLNSLLAPMKVRTCPATCVVEYYLTSRPYIACQTDALRQFSDSPAWNMLWNLLINYFRYSRSGEDKKEFSQTTAPGVRDRLAWFVLKSLGKLDQRSELSYLQIHTAMNFVFLDFFRNGIAVPDWNLNLRNNQLNARILVL